MSQPRTLIPSNGVSEKQDGHHLGVTGILAKNPFLHVTSEMSATSKVWKEAAGWYFSGDDDHWLARRAGTAHKQKSPGPLIPLAHSLLSCFCKPRWPFPDFPLCWRRVPLITQRQPASLWEKVTWAVSVSSFRIYAQAKIILHRKTKYPECNYPILATIYLA